VLRRKLFKQRFRFLQITRIKTLSKPPVNRSKQLPCLPHLALVAPEACEPCQDAGAVKAAAVLDAPPTGVTLLSHPLRSTLFDRHPSRQEAHFARASVAPRYSQCLEGAGEQAFVGDR
jgi:hypothetical protein